MAIKVISDSEWQSKYGVKKVPSLPLDPVQPTVKEKQPSATKYLPSAVGEVLGSIKDAPKSFYNAVKALPIVNNLTPMGVTTQQLGQAPVQGKLVKNINSYTKANDEFITLISQKLKDPNVTPQEKASYREILKNNTASVHKTIPDIQNQVTSGVTPTAIGADAAISALMAVTGYNPALNGLVKSGALASGQAVKAANTLSEVVKATSAAERIAKFGKTGGAIANATIKYGVPAIKDLALNEGILTASNVAAGKDIKTAAQEALGPASLLSAVPPALTAVIGGVGRELGMAKQLAGEGLDSAATKLERFATGAGKAAEESKTLGVADRIIADASRAEPGLAQRTAGKVAAGIRQVQSIPQKYVDRFSPFFAVEKRIAEITGQLPKDEYAVGIKSRLASDAAANTTTQDARALFGENGKGGALSPYNDIRKQILERERLLDAIDRVKLGNDVTGVKVTKENQSALLGELQAGVDKHIAQNAAQEQRIQQALKIRADYNRTYLDKLYKSGFISQESYNKIIQAHPNYIPHNVVQDTAEQSSFGVSGSMNPKQPLKGAVGSTRSLENTDMAIIDRTAQINRAVTNNDVVGSLVKAQEQFNVVPGMRMVTESSPAAKGEQTINLWRNGVKESWVVPNDIAVAVKNLDPVTLPKALRFLTSPVRLLKRFATKYNLSFSVPNLARDRQEATITANAFIQSMVESSGATGKAVDLTENELRDVYQRIGGYGGSSIMNEGTGQALKGLQPRGLVKSFLNKTNPARIVEHINSELELSTREAVFRTALERGLTPQQAAFASREATVDFAKMGTHMQMLNQFIPFLNARVQGTINAFRAAGAAPEIFARRVYWTAVLPQIGLYNWNRQFASAKNVPQYIRDNYWYIVTGETKGLDSNGNPAVMPKMVTIKKGQIQQLISNPIEYFLAKNDKNDPRTVDQMLISVIGSASPVAIGSGGGYSNIWLSLLSQAGPAANITVGLGTNVDPWRGNTIVPQEATAGLPKDKQSQYDPEFLKALGKKFNVSSAQIAFAINSLGGGATDISTITDMLYKKFTGKDGSLNPSEPSAFGQATRLPVTSKVLREATPQQNPNYQQNLQKKVTTNQQVVHDKLQVKNFARQIDQKLLSLKTTEERTKYLDSLGSQVTPEIRKQLKAIVTARNSAGILKTTDSVELRARYIDLRMREMAQAGLSAQQLTDYLDSLESQKILTKDVRQRLVQIKKSIQ